MHPDQETLLAMMESAGLVRCRCHDVMNGICAIHVGFKPLPGMANASLKT